MLSRTGELEMRNNQVRGCRSPRHGVAATEMALLLPCLLVILLGAADFAQVFSYAVVITNCARNGALYGSSSPTASTDTTGIQTAALVDAGSLSPSVSSSTGTDTFGSYVNVTVSYDVTLYCSFLGIGDPFTVSSTIRMRVLPGS
jgi:Flp pilus assembly protein TadG